MGKEEGGAETYLVPWHKDCAGEWTEWRPLELQGNCSATIDQNIKPGIEGKSIDYIIELNFEEAASWHDSSFGRHRRQGGNKLRRIAEKSEDVAD